MAAIMEQIGPLATTLVGTLAGYGALCTALRCQRRDRKHTEMPYKTREDFKNMTGEDAWMIVKYIISLEFPFLSEKAFSFALFKTYGIPSISKLLCETQQLGKAEYAGRRYVDTSILIVEFLAQSPTSERANSAIARMNYMHNRYQKAGKINNDDMLYTLSLFVLEPERWIRQYEWRSLTPMEKCAMGTHWKSIGDAMGIDFADLHHGPNFFKDGLEFFEDIEMWATEYEIRCMVPNKHNHQLAEETTRILLADVPELLKPFGRNVVTTLLDERLRSAMMYEKPSAIYPFIVNTILGVRKFFLRFLIPPRPYFLRRIVVTEEADPKTGRYYATNYDMEPWYVKPTFAMRYSPMAWYRWATGRPYPDGKNYKPEGYNIFDVGPKKLEGHGMDECNATLAQLMSENRGRCPFAIS